MPSSLGIVASGEDVLNDAVLWLDASLSSVSGGKLTNLGKGGSALDAQFGSTTSTDTNDPLLLTHTGTNYLYLPGVGTFTNSVTSPSSTALNSVTGDAEFLLDFAMDSWNTSTVDVVGRNGADPNRVWMIRILSTGVPRLAIYPSGTNASIINYTCPSVVPFTAAQRGQLKITLDVDNGSSQSVATFSTATDGSTFTTLGTATGAVTSLLGTTATGLAMNVSQGASEFAGKLYRFSFRNGIGGTTVFDADFTTGITSGAQATFTESSANAATVTINRATSGRKAVAVTRNVLLFGTDDYLEVADNDLLNFGASESFTVVAVARVWATLPAFASIMAKKISGNVADVGWSIYVATAGALNPRLSDGTVQPAPSPGTLTSGSLRLVGVVRNVGADTITGYLNNAANSITDSSTGTFANAEVLRIGRLSGSGTSYTDMEFIAAAVFRRVLTANEIATIVARYT